MESTTQLYNNGILGDMTLHELSHQDVPKRNFLRTTSSLLRESNFAKGDKLVPLTPFIDDALLRVRRRLNKTPLTYIAKHPNYSKQKNYKITV